jgi:hypothetical protein
MRPQPPETRLCNSVSLSEKYFPLKKMSNVLVYSKSECMSTVHEMSLWSMTTSSRLSQRLILTCRTLILWSATPHVLAPAWKCIKTLKTQGKSALSSWKPLKTKRSEQQTYQSSSSRFCPTHWLPIRVQKSLSILLAVFTKKKTKTWSAMSSRNKKANGGH